MSRRLNLSIQYVTRAPWVPERAQVVRWARAALDCGGTITVRFVDEDEGRALNHDYRGKDYATNVLSFPYEYEPQVIGDLVIAPAVCAREATEQGKSLEAHMAHLIVHGVLHLQGYDHDDVPEEDAEAMETLERAIVMQLGYTDPYASERAAP